MAYGLYSGMWFRTWYIFARSLSPYLFLSSFCRLADAQHPERIPGHRCCRYPPCLCKLSLALHRYPKIQIHPSARNYGTILPALFSRALRGLCLLFGWNTAGCRFWPGTRRSARSDDGVRFYSPSRSLIHVLTVVLTASPGEHPSFSNLESISSVLSAVSCPWTLTCPPQRLTSGSIGLALFSSLLGWYSLCLCWVKERVHRSSGERDVSLHVP